MAGENDAKAAAGFSAAAAIAAAIGLLRKQAGGVFPPEVIQLLVAIAGTSEDTKGIVQQILEALATGGGGQGWPSNTDSITAVRVAIAVAGTQMPYIAVPSGMALVIKAWALNPGFLQVGATQAECTQVNQSFPLLPNEVVTYQVENADKIWIGATAAGCFACLTVEQRRLGGG
jgi:hypothetical protein